MAPRNSLCRWFTHAELTFILVLQIYGSQEPNETVEQCGKEWKINFQFVIKWTRFHDFFLNKQDAEVCEKISFLSLQCFWASSKSLRFESQRKRKANESWPLDESKKSRIHSSLLFLLILEGVWESLKNKSSSSHIANDLWPIHIACLLFHSCQFSQVFIIEVF